jgi:hypothetical protein
MAVTVVVPEAKVTDANVPGVRSPRLPRVIFVTRVLLVSCSVTEPLDVCTVTLAALTLVILPATP